MNLSLSSKLSKNQVEEIEEYIIDFICDTQATHEELIEELDYCYQNRLSHHISNFERILKDTNITRSDLLVIGNHTYYSYCKNVD